MLLVDAKQPHSNHNNNSHAVWRSFVIFVQHEEWKGRKTKLHQKYELRRFHSCYLWALYDLPHSDVSSQLQWSIAVSRWMSPVYSHLLLCLFNFLRRACALDGALPPQWEDSAGNLGEENHQNWAQSSAAAQLQQPLGYCWHYSAFHGRAVSCVMKEIKCQLAFNVLVLTLLC